MHLEIIHAVKEMVGEDYPLLLRLGALDYQEGGNTMEDAVFAAKAFEDAGISILDVSGGVKEIEFAEEIVRTGQTDLVGIGRAVLKDSDWIQKAAQIIGL